MASVYIPVEYRQLADSLVKKVDLTGSAVFTSNMELMCLAAMIGYSEWGENIEAEEYDNGTEVPLDVFERNRKDGLAYLLALHIEKDGEILRAGKEGECWDILEKYSAAGFRIINDWMNENPGTLLDNVETILSQMKIVAGRLIEEEDTADLPNIVI